VICRHWRGVAKTDKAEEYIRHLREETFPGLDGIDGFLGAEILRRPVEEGVEFVVLTRWTSLESIQRFAGGDIDKAVVPPEAEVLMVSFDASVRHYELVP